MGDFRRLWATLGLRVGLLISCLSTISRSIILICYVAAKFKRNDVSLPGYKVICALCCAVTCWLVFVVVAVVAVVLCCF